MCESIKKPATSMASSRARPMCCFGDVALCAVRRHPHRTHAKLVGPLEVARRPDARKQQSGEPRMRQHRAASAIHSSSVWRPKP